MKKRLFAAAALGVAALALPARAQITVVGVGVEERQARPGETYSGTLRLRNEGGEAAEARLYLTDYAFSADGATTYGAAGSAPRSNARWVTFTPSHVRIPAGGEATVGYTVAVPAGGALQGTYWSMLMVEGIAPGAPESATAPRGPRTEVGVRTTLRYGVQLATTLPGSGARRADFRGTRAVGAANGEKRIELDLVNSGEVAYRPELRIELFDEAGNAAGTFTSRRGLLYPGTSLRQVFELGALPAGTYQALVTADTGGDEVFGAQYRLKL